MSAEIIAVTLATTEPESAPDFDQSTSKKVRDSTKWLHKTRLCVYNIQGSCRLGSKCSFAHTASEVQDAPNLHKTQLCEAFQKGKCNDPNCSFAHGEEELRLSPNFKNKLCKWFGKGKCRNGDECGFAHGPEELRNERRKMELIVESQLPPPPGLSLEANEAVKKEPLVLDLQASLTSTKAPASLEQQVEGMSSTIAALQCKMDEMVLRTQVTGMKQFLGQLSAQCQELEQALNTTQNPSDVKANAPWKKTPLKTKLSSKASPFQPTNLSCQAMPFMPSGQIFMSSYESGQETAWPSDDSTSIGSGGGWSSD